MLIGPIPVSKPSWGCMGQCEGQHCGLDRAGSDWIHSMAFNQRAQISRKGRMGCSPIEDDRVVSLSRGERTGSCVRWVFLTCAAIDRVINFYMYRASWPASGLRSYQSFRSTRGYERHVMILSIFTQV
jgi:hypothetical protein